jgi:hypothetical protein
MIHILNAKNAGVSRRVAKRGLFSSMRASLRLFLPIVLLFCYALFGGAVFYALEKSDLNTVLVRWTQPVYIPSAFCQTPNAERSDPTVERGWECMELWKQMDANISMLYANMTLDWQLMPLRRRALRILSIELQANCTVSTVLANQLKNRANITFWGMVYFAFVVFCTIGYGARMFLFN